jgi:HSP20 family molecular chaperone IbpA
MRAKLPSQMAHRETETVRRANGVRCRFSADTLSSKANVAEGNDAIDVTAELPGVGETNGWGFDTHR